MCCLHTGSEPSFRLPVIYCRFFGKFGNLKCIGNTNENELTVIQSTDFVNDLHDCFPWDLIKGFPRTALDGWWGVDVLNHIWRLLSGASVAYRQVFLQLADIASAVM